MFIDEKTGVSIYANLNESVSRATLLASDLIPAFLDVIRDTPEYCQLIQSLSGDLLVITDAGADSRDERWDSEDMSYFLNEELWDVLNMYAPYGYYFGATDGDGSDFGYWSDEEEEE